MLENGPARVVSGKPTGEPGTILSIMFWKKDGL